MVEVFSVVSSRPGIIRLGDGAVLVLRIAVAGVRNIGFSPFGGVNFAVKTVGGVASLFVPDELKERVRDKPFAPLSKLASEGWEIVDIAEQEPAEEEVRVRVGDRYYTVSVAAEAVMVSRNMNYRTEFNEPLYSVQWSVKVRWKPVEG